MLNRIPTSRPATGFAARPLLNNLAAALAPFWPAEHKADTFVLRLARANQRRPAGPNTIALDLERRHTPGFPAVAALQRQYSHELASLRALAAAGVAVPPPDDAALLALGRTVAGLLTPGTRTALLAALRQTRARGRHLRLILEAQPDASAALGIPWELLVLPLGWGAPGAVAADDFVLLHADVSLTRQISGLGQAPATRLALPLHVQGVAAAPPDSQPIDLVAAQRALAPAVGERWYAGPNTLAELHARQRASPAQIVHLLCHGELCDTGRSTRCHLLLTHADGRAQRVAAPELARGLAASRKLQLVMLQACHTGTVADAAGGLADSAALTLLHYGVPAVVAMQGEVGHEAAQMFVRTCYAALAAGRPIEQAVAHGRVAMRAAGGLADWALPVLYVGSRTRRG